MLNYIMARQDNIETLHKFIVDNFNYSRWIDSRNYDYDGDMEYPDIDECMECDNCKIPCTCDDYEDDENDCILHVGEPPCCTTSPEDRLRLAASKFNRNILEQSTDEYLSYLMMLMTAIKERKIKMMDEESMAITTSCGFIFTATGDLLIYHPR